MTLSLRGKSGSFGWEPTDEALEAMNALWDAGRLASALRAALAVDAPKIARAALAEAKAASRDSWTCRHGVTYAGSEDFVSGARNAHGEYDAAIHHPGSADLIGFKPMADDDPWTVRRCPIHELVVTDDDRCPVVLSTSDVICCLPLSEPFEVRVV